MATIKIKILAEKPIVLYPELARKFGILEALFIQQAIYWTQRNNNEDGWFYKTDKEWREEIPMTEWELKQVKKRLKEKGIIETKRMKVHAYGNGVPVCHYRVNLYELERLGFVEILQTGSEESSNPDGRNSPIPNNTENTYRDYNTKKNKNIYNHTVCLPGEARQSDKDQAYLPLAEELADIVRTKKNIRIDKRKLKAWAHEIRLLVERDLAGQVEENIARVRAALAWYRENIGGEYVPVIESGQSLRRKFIRLEQAMERDRNGHHRSSIPKPRDHARPSDYYSIENMPNVITVNMDEWEAKHEGKP